MEELKKALKKSGLFTVITTGTLLLISTLVIISGLLIWNSVTKQNDTAEAGEVIGMIFVIIIMAAIVIIMEIVGIGFFIFNALGLSFGLYLLCNNKYDINKIKRKRGILVTIIVFLFLMALILFIGGILLIISVNNAVLGIIGLCISGGLITIGVLQSKNNKKINHLIKDIEELDNNSNIIEKVN